MIQAMSARPHREATTPAETPRSSGRRRSAIASIETELATLTRHLERVSRQSHIYDRLDRSGYLLARTLHGRGPTAIGALAAELGLDATTVTRQVAAMDAEGLVARARAPPDGRSSLASLAEAGVQPRDEVRAAREARISTLLAGWSGEDRRSLGEVLARFNAAIRANP